MSPRRRLWRVLAVAVSAALLAAPAAWGHATLESTAPARGAALERAPQQVSFRFSEPVEAAFGAVRVYDGQGERVDRGAVSRPDGRSDEIAIGLRDGLGDGTYTATYRVISADSHPVSGGYVFTVGEGGAPATTLDELIDAGRAGPATEIGFGLVRGLSYLALALAAGGVVFVAAVWLPSLRFRAGAGPRWREASEAFAGRARAITLGAAALGALMSALGIVFQGAVAAGTSFWQALDPTVIGDVLETRFGTVWGLRFVAWLAAGALLALPGRRVRTSALALVLAFLCLTPALAGHASTVSPGWLLVPANFLHVAAMSVWVGGVAMLVFALPAATRRLEPPSRTALLATVVSGFSTVALVAVAALVASGAVQAIVEVDGLSELVDTPFGRAILIKIGLAACLIALGAWNRRRIRPRLAALDEAGATPGAAGLALRRSIRTELALMVAVLGVTAALVSYAPALGTTGPFSASEPVGPALLELTVDPARAGANEVHLYLFDRRTGAQFGRAKELTVTARLPERKIGPLRLDAEKAGPGHYVVRHAPLAPAGDWRLEVSVRVSEFDAYAKRIQVPVR